MNTIIIGAGASGLIAAIRAAEKGASVTVIEHENKPGKKILITGNGKCNLTNLNMDCQKYYGNSTFIQDVISVFNEKDCIKFFHDMGLVTKDKQGYIYPMSEQAATVLNTLRNRAVHLGVKIKTNNIVEKIRISEMGFDIYTGIVLHCDHLILATGGMAFPKTGSDGSGYQLAESLGHHIVKPKPALTALICENNHLNKAAGVRIHAKISVVRNDDIIGSDIGELQITDYGVSGIPVFNISRLTEKGTYIFVDFLPEIDFDKVQELLDRLLHKRSYMTVAEALNGCMNDKLVTALLQSINVEKSMQADCITKEQIKQIALQIKEYKMIVKSRRGFDYAQVTQGGVDTNEIDSKTMESKLIKNLYFAGELIDVDGICGGYNLQFAWATGVIAGGNCIR